MTTRGHRAAMPVLLLATMLLGACAGLEDHEAPSAEERVEPTAPEEGVEEAVDEVPADPEPEPEEDPTADAVRDLLREAQQASDEGDHERSGALLERALRITPDNAVLWHNLAVVRYRQDELDQAESMAQRSLSHLSDNPDLERRNWEIIAVSRHLRDDEAGADEAARRAEGVREAGGE